MSGTSLTEQKKALRLLIKERKKTLDVKDREVFSSQIFDILKQNELFQKAKTILCYWSMPDEVETHTFVQNHLSEKVWLLPVVKDDTLEIRQFTGVHDLQQGVLNIGEPLGQPFEGNIDLAVIPGMAFDRDGNRLGRGKGYYDKFLLQHNLHTIAVAFYCQIVDEVPVGKWDVKMHHIITEKGIITPIA